VKRMNSRSDAVHNPFTIPQWIAWLGATVAAAISMMVYIASTYETKEHQKENRDQIERRLERMENKLDRLISRDPK